MADLNPKTVGGWALSEGWCECPCAGCGEALLIHQGDEVCAVFADDGRVAYLLCHACARRNNEEFRRRRKRASGLRRLGWCLVVVTAGLGVAGASFGGTAGPLGCLAAALLLGLGLRKTRRRGGE